jgi:hypothetical protein
MKRVANFKSFNKTADKKCKFGKSLKKFKKNVNKASINGYMIIDEK